MKMKLDFLQNEIWILTFAGGFQRTKIYTGTINEEQRSDYRKLLRNYIEGIVEESYQKDVSEEEHLVHIQSIVNYSDSLEEFQKNAKMNFGVAQKLLNLYLKYLWCMEVLKFAPPHFPVDRIIQERLNEKAKEYKLKSLKIEPWTQFEDKNKYMAVIDFAREIIKESNGQLNYSLPELELNLFIKG